MSPESPAYKKDHLSAPAGYFFWTGVDPAGIAYNKSKVTAADAPKTWKDILNPRWKARSAARFPRPACSSCSGTCCARSTATVSGRSSPSSSRTPSIRACSCSTASPRATTHHRDRRISGLHPLQERGAEVEFVAPPDGLVATPLIVGAVNKAPHPEAAKLFVDWAMSKRGQA